MRNIFIKDYEGLYEVNTEGDVYSLPRTIVGSDGIEYPFTGRYLAKILNKSTGYLYCSLWKNNKQTTCSIHRIVAETFIPNPLNHPVVNHIDGNKLNNSVSNLEWCTHQANSKHAVDMGLKTYTSKLTKEDFLYYLDCVIAG